MFDWLDCFKPGDDDNNEDTHFIIILNKGQITNKPIIKQGKTNPIICNNKVPFKKKQVSWKNTPIIESALSSDEYDRSVDWDLHKRNCEMYKRLKRHISGKHISKSLSNT